MAVRRLWPLALFLMVFTLTLLWRFPVESLVSGRVADLEARTGATLRWQDASWSLWHSRLHDVQVDDAQGKPLLHLDTLDLTPRGRGIQARGLAAWGSLQAWARSDEVDVEVKGLPLPPLPDGMLEGATLSGHAHMLTASSRLDGQFEAKGRARIAQQGMTVYEGDLTATATLEMRGSTGRLGLELRGTGLGGRGSLEVDTSGGLQGLRLSGPLEVEKPGLPLITLKVQGGPGHWQFTPEFSRHR